MTTINIILSTTAILIWFAVLCRIHATKLNLIKYFKSINENPTLGNITMILILLSITMLCLLPISNMFLIVFLLLSPLTLTLFEKFWKWFESIGV
jgi:hypothetical protein